MTKILRIDYSPYTLEAKYHPNSKTNNVKRHGFLLRFLFKGIGFGYADCHPLEEFGDDSVHTQLSLLKEKKFTTLTQRSAYFAKLDATFRSDERPAFSNEEWVEPKEDTFLKNHYTSPATIKKEDILALKSKGFEKFKFKFGRHIPNEINYIKDNAKFFVDNQIQIRIDYNGSLKQKSVLSELKEFKDVIDFIEDPFESIDEKTSDTLAEYSQYFNFAMDFVHPDTSFLQSEKYFAYRIVKPARENFNKIKFTSPKKIVFTSSMDHPLGQICALFEAYQKTKEQCGLMTHHLFESNSYSEQLIVKNARLLPVGGTGFGFDELLKTERWQKCF